MDPQPDDNPDRRTARESPPVAAAGLTRRRIEYAAFAVVVVIAVVLGIVLFTGQGEDDATAAGANPASISDEDRASADGGVGPLGDLARRTEGDALAMGAVDAPVVLVEFADYRCPFCAKFSQDIKPELIDRYVDSGQLRIEWRDLPIYGEESARAARAGRAAAAQGRFWEFNSALYAAAPESGHAEMSPERLRGFAVDAGVPDIDRFMAQMNSDDFEALLHVDTMTAQRLGIPATPAFSVNGHPILGAQPIDTFTSMIDRLLAEQ
ncbi:DsbA family protein [Tomitella fengzijianii]|uniref:Disulfide bond formation protein n=1 Tax=Tomitella fengzijianii TaxID=2597660 RepID=A0A516X1U9_9ACTN|nr:thioredoxin domain-containing protein [Tomitella fengzijianii]QDQ96987.1 disulfide bond formation protein [Tomitella fengzijianii]